MIKKLKLTADEFEENDLVVCKAKDDAYIILEITHTLLHGHKMLRYRFTDGEVCYDTAESFGSTPREVYRWVEE